MKSEKMKLKLLSVGRFKDPILQQATQVYLDRLKHFLPFKMEEVREFPFRKGMSAKIVVDQEAETLFEKLPDGSYYVVLDEHGKQKTSEGWAEMFGRWENESRKEVVFIIGGAFGVSESILRGARDRLALSKLTFTHEMARVIFVEQVYRAYTILKGIPYHHGNPNPSYRPHHS